MLTPAQQLLWAAFNGLLGVHYTRQTLKGFIVDYNHFTRPVADDYIAKIAAGTHVLGFSNENGILQPELRECEPVLPSVVTKPPPLPLLCPHCGGMRAHSPSCPDNPIGLGKGYDSRGPV